MCGGVKPALHRCTVTYRSCQLTRLGGLSLSGIRLYATPIHSPCVTLLARCNRSAVHRSTRIGRACPAPLRVMSFNVRVPVDTDGDKRWEVRRTAMVALIEQAHPDVSARKSW